MTTTDPTRIVSAEHARRERDLLIERCAQLLTQVTEGTVEADGDILEWIGVMCIRAGLWSRLTL